MCGICLVQITYLYGFGEFNAHVSRHIDEP